MVVLQPSEEFLSHTLLLLVIAGTIFRLEVIPIVKVCLNLYLKDRFSRWCEATAIVQDANEEHVYLFIPNIDRPIKHNRGERVLTRKLTGHAVAGDKEGTAERPGFMTIFYPIVYIAAIKLISIYFINN
jgi:hypothetical protein